MRVIGWLLVRDGEDKLEVMKEIRIRRMEVDEDD